MRWRRTPGVVVAVVLMLSVGLGTTVAEATTSSGATTPAPAAMRAWTKRVCRQLDHQIGVFRGWQGDIARLASATTTATLSSSDLTAVRQVTTPVVLRLQSGTRALRAIGAPPRAASGAWWRQYWMTWSTLSRGLTEFYTGISGLVSAADGSPDATTAGVQSLGEQFAAVRQAIAPALAALADDPVGAAFQHASGSLSACRRVRQFQA